MFVHSVYFWLKEGLSASEVEDYECGLKSLGTITSVREFHIGKPAGTDRPVIDRSYSYGMVAVFEDQLGHDVYQEDAIHDAFRKDCSRYWSKVLIYDFSN
ncbi:MAG TPA: Dabb family protein [Blastocatellia bacterium]|nr:Dabb family protein [Blastocatellia bacterium]